jgi:hypothetical protein
MNSRKFAMNYGAILGSCLVAIATLMWSFGLASGLHIPFLLNNGLVVFGIAYAIINFRDAENNGFISYSESVRLGTSVVFFSALILAFYTFVFMRFIGLDTNILASIKAEAVEAILQQNLESAEEEKSLNLIDKIFTLKWWIIGGTLTHTLIGFIYSLIISIFTKKDHLEIL